MAKNNYLPRIKNPKKKKILHNHNVLIDLSNNITYNSRIVMNNIFNIDKKKNHKKISNKKINFKNKSNENKKSKLKRINLFLFLIIN